MVTVQRRLVMIYSEMQFYYHAPYIMHYFCQLSRLTRVACVCVREGGGEIAVYTKHVLIRIGDQAPLVTVSVHHAH